MELIMGSSSLEKLVSDQTRAQATRAKWVARRVNQIPCPSTLVVQIASNCCRAEEHHFSDSEGLTVSTQDSLKHGSGYSAHAHDPFMKTLYCRIHTRKAPSV
eukprot:scpid91186/ scgid18567/ 